MKPICGHSNSEGEEPPLLNSVSDGGVILNSELELQKSISLDFAHYSSSSFVQEYQF